MSSQLFSRPSVVACACPDEKSGARNGLDIWNCLTDCGTTWRSSSAAFAGASVTTTRSSGLSSLPASISMVRRSSCAEVVSGALSVSS